MNRDHCVYSLTFKRMPIVAAIKLLIQYHQMDATHATLVISRRVPSGQAKRRAERTLARRPDSRL